MCGALAHVCFIPDSDRESGRRCRTKITEWPCDGFPHSESRANLLGNNNSNFEIFSECALKSKEK